MSSKLLKLKRKHGYGRPVNMRIELPYSADQVRATITLMLMPNGTVNLCGVINEEGLSREMMRVGMERLLQHHRQRRAVQVGGLVGLDGEPIRRDS